MQSTLTRTSAMQARLSESSSIYSFRTCLCIHHDPNGAFYKDAHPLDTHYFECQSCSKAELIRHLIEGLIPEDQAVRIGGEINTSKIPNSCPKGNCKKTLIKRPR